MMNIVNALFYPFYLIMLFRNRIMRGIAQCEYLAGTYEKQLSDALGKDFLNLFDGEKKHE